MSLFSFDANDPSINVVRSGAPAPNNKAGLFGSYTAGLLNDFFGVGAIFWPFVFAFLGAAYVSARFTMRWWRWCGFFILTLSILTGASALDLSLGDLAGGGVIGKTLYLSGNHYFSPAGSLLIWIFITLIGLQLSGNFSWFNLLSHSWTRLKTLINDLSNGKLAAESCKDVFAQLPAKAKAALNSASGWPGAAIARIKPKLQALRLSTPAPEISAAETLPPLNLPPASDQGPMSAPEKSVSHEAPLENIRIVPPDEASVPEPGPMPEEESDFSWEEEDVESQAEASAHMEDVEPRHYESAPMAHGHQPENGRQDEELILPSLNLLTPPEAPQAASAADIENKGRALMQCLEDFDIKSKLAGITPGPVVTMYQVRPDPGVRVNTISKLNDDLSLALKAVSVRIQAPIPGSDTVGIEIPNDHREMVNFREIAETDAFQNATGPLTMILGKDISGKPYLADLSKMPHLLIAGATGAGKSVCLNSILVSMLYRLKPRDLRLLLVDPKRIEMAVYADLPHLIHPVVTEMDDAKNALEWAIKEMDDRFKALGRLGARNMATYNQKLAAMGNRRLPEHEDLRHMPYLVIVIDELADLMMTAAREAQTSILRLAQLARAAGIHMILATQRPSVDVVTGLIKANFLNRISFQVTSRHDSRTILDQPGAEYLLGKGDMLYKPSSGPLLRLHGPFLSDEEVAAVAAHWKEQQAPEYEIDFSQWGTEPAASEPDPGAGMKDPLYEKVRAFVLEQGVASISMLQRHFSVGFGRSGRLIAQLEREGLLGPAEGSKPRKVLH